jgi:hypothetical protein
MKFVLLVYFIICDKRNRRARHKLYVWIGGNILMNRQSNVVSCSLFITTLYSTFNKQIRCIQFKACYPMYIGMLFMFLSHMGLLPQLDTASS